MDDPVRLVTDAKEGNWFLDRAHRAVRIATLLYLPHKEFIKIYKPLNGFLKRVKTLTVTNGFCCSCIMQ